MISSIPSYFGNTESPIICYNKPIFNFNNLVSDLDIETLESINQPAGHITGNVKITSDSRIRSVISKGPNYRFTSQIDFKNCREDIASPINDYWWCKREHVESVDMFCIISLCIAFV